MKNSSNLVYGVIIAYLQISEIANIFDEEGLDIPVTGRCKLRAAPVKGAVTIMEAFKLSGFKERFENQQKHVHLIALVSPT